jgi:hypothetical protein
MSYYPLSQIKTNLYTNGQEFTLTPYTPSNSYVGSYWSTSDGKFFTGKTPQDTPNSEIFKIPNSDPTTPQPFSQITLDVISSVESQPSLETYIVTKKIDPNFSISVPTQNITLPTIQDYQIGEFRRYFCKKTNELLYIEIDKSTYDKLVNKDPQIMWQLYTPINLAWQISGNKEKVANTNKNMISLAMQRQKLYRFDEYLKFDYTKYFL